MKTKFFTLLSLGVLALLMVMSFASASLDFYDKTNDVDLPIVSATVEQGSSVTVSFRLNESGDNDISVISFDAPITMTYSSYSLDSEATVSGIIATLPKGTTSSVMSLTFDVPEFQEVGTYNGILTVDAIGDITGALSDTLDVELTVTEKSRPDEINACHTTGNPDNDLQLKIKDVTVISGFGKDNEWLPLDEIEVEIEVKNDNNDEKMKDIVVGWGLYNSETEEWYVDDEENDFRLKSNDKEILTFSFKLDEDIDELADGTYVLYVWTNSVLDASTEQDLCTIASEEIGSIEIESDFVILDDIKYTETASCGSQVQVTADVWNIGDEDQTDVFVVIHDEVLGISKKIVIGDIDAFDDSKIDVLIDIPQDAEEETYYLTLSVFDEYGEVFVNDYDDDKAEFPIYLKVEGNCIGEPRATVSANLESEAKAGKELIIRTTVVNTGTKTSTFDISLSNINWASVESVSSTSVTLDAGEAEDVIVTLKVNSDVSGNQEFKVIVTEGTKVLAQPIAVMIEKGGLLDGITGGVISGDNWPIWTIGAINVILVFIIILVALKVAKK